MINPQDFKEIRFPVRVEAQKIRELALSVSNTHPVFHDPRTARESGYQDIPAPLTYPVLMLFWGYPSLWNFLDELQIDVSRMLHTGEDYEYHHLIYPGDELTGTIRLHGYSEIGSMRRISVQCQFLKQEKLMCSLVIQLLSMGDD